MKKLLFTAIFLIATLSVLSSEVNAQTQQYQTTSVSTVATFKDTTKNYTYSNVYMVVQSTNLTRGSSMMLMPGAQDSTSFKKWNLTYNVSIYSSESDYRTGKQPVSYWNGSVLLTQSFPTEAEIITAIKNHLPK